MAARLAGSLAGQQSRPDDVRRFAKLAQGIYEELGDAHGSAASVVQDRGQDEYGAASAHQPLDRINIVPRSAGQSSPLSADELEFVSSMTPRAGSKVSEAFAQRFTQAWGKVSTRLQALLYSPETLQAVRRVPEPAALGLLIPQSFLNTLPWEIAPLPFEERPGRSQRVRVCSRIRYGQGDLPHETIRFVQQRLRESQFGGMHADGILGPLTNEAIKRFQKAESLPQTGLIDRAVLSAIRQLPWDGKAPPVLIVQSGAALSEYEYTSYSSRGASSLSSYYEPFADVEVVDGSFERMSQALAAYQPSLVHVVASVRETSGIVFLDFARRRSTSEGAPITTTALDTLVKRVYESSARPFLILDVVRPSSTFDASIALGLRNSFAADLLYFSSFSGVLATGFEQPRMLGNIAAAIGTHLREHCSMGILANEIRSLCALDAAQDRGSDAHDRVLAYLATALFAQDPDLPCLTI
jgi:hypothetical protein